MPSLRSAALMLPVLAATAALPSAQAASARSCPNVKVPGHRAVNLKALGASCVTAKKVASAAEGRGRAAYSASSFRCTPRNAAGGDTTYTCKKRASRITFLYGAA